MASLAAYGLVPLSEMEGELAHAARGLPLHDQHGKIRAFAVVDREDFEAVSRLRWSFKDGYALRYFGGRPPRRKCERLHRRLLALEHGDGRQVDHINRVRLDNRRSNLRVVSGDAENRQNVPARGGSSQFRGVTYDNARGRWAAQARLAGRRYFLGRYATEQEAADVAAAWRRVHMPYSND